MKTFSYTFHLYLHIFSPSLSLDLNVFHSFFHQQSSLFVAHFVKISFMGAKQGKTKNISISEKLDENEKLVKSTSNDQMNGTTTLEKKVHKRSAKTSKSKVNQCTSTEGGFISTLLRTKHLANGSNCNKTSHDVNSCDIKSEVSMKDILDFREACMRRGIISSATIKFGSEFSNEQDHQINHQENLKTVVSNNEQVDQTQEKIES